MDTPGRYADPDPPDPARQRWFGGHRWTEHRDRSAPPPARRRTLLLIAGATTGAVLLGALAAAAVPVYRDGQERARLAAVTSTTCDDVADEAVQLGRTQPDLAPLASVAGATVSWDGRAAVRIPAPGVEAFVMTCAGMGTRPDGSVAPLTMDLYIDHERTHLLWYSWDT